MKTKEKKTSTIFSLPGRNLRLDIPLDTRIGTEFLAMLMALMTFLCILAGVASVSLHLMANNWTSALANTLTIEIPSSVPDRKIIPAIEKIRDINGVKTAERLSKAEMQKLVEPWLGQNNAAIDDLPIPSLINIEIDARSPELLQKVTGIVKDIDKDIRIDAHEEWLADILKLSRALQMASIGLIAVIGFVTAVTVGGAVRSRMAIHHLELELLHIMGASDRYITRQFQKYVLWLSGKGILSGLLISLAIIGLAHQASKRLPDTLPHFEFVPEHLLVLPAISLCLFIIIFIAAGRAAMTVLRKMP